MINKKYNWFLVLLFFAYFFATQISLKSVDYSERSIDFQVLFRLLITGSLFFYALRYVPSYINNYLEKLWGIHAFLFLAILFALIRGEFYSAYAVVTLLMALLIIYKFSSVFGWEVLRFYHCFVFLFCLISIFYYYFIPEIGRYTYWQDGVIFQSPRMQGIAGHPNTLGFMLGSAILLSLTFGKRFFYSRYGLLSTAVIIIGLVLTNSRTNLMAVLLLSCFYYFAIIGYALQFFILLATLVFGTILVYLIAPEVLQSVLGGVSRTGDLQEIFSFTGRSDIWQIVLSKFYESPLIGWGYAKSADILGMNSDAVGFTVGQAHNLYLQVLISLGLLGAIIFFSWYVWLLLYSVRCKKYGQLIIFLYIAIVGFTETIILNTIANNAFLVFCMALIADFPDEQC